MLSDVYTLTNIADTPRDVQLVTNCVVDNNDNLGNVPCAIEPDEVTTSYYTFEGVTATVEEGREGYSGPIVDLDDKDDAYSTLDNINLEIDYEASQAVFTITTPTGMIGSSPGTYSGSVAFILDEDADGKTDWQVEYEPGSLKFDFGGDWGYEEALESGANPEPRNFVDATTISGIGVARDGDSFILKVDLDMLGGIGSEYKIGFFISVLTEYWGGIIDNPTNAADQVKIFYPTYNQFDWADTSNYETRTIGTEITSATLQPLEPLDFVVSNTFKGVGTYTITTSAVPQ